MNHNIAGAVIALTAGLIIAFINYLISEKVLIKAPEKYSLITVIRQALQVGFLALTYFAGVKTQLADPSYLLVGAVAGLTLPMFYFTRKLLKVNEQATENRKEKGGKADG